MFWAGKGYKVISVKPTGNHAEVVLYCDGDRTIKIVGAVAQKILSGEKNE